MEESKPAVVPVKEAEIIDSEVGVEASVEAPVAEVGVNGDSATAEPMDSAETDVVFKEPLPVANTAPAVVTDAPTTTTTPNVNGSDAASIASNESTRGSAPDLAALDKEESATNGTNGVDSSAAVATAPLDLSTMTHKQKKEMTQKVSSYAAGLTEEQFEAEYIRRFECSYMAKVIDFPLEIFEAMAQINGDKVRMNLTQFRNLFNDDLWDNSKMVLASSWRTDPTVTSLDLVLPKGHERGLPFPLRSFTKEMQEDSEKRISTHFENRERTMKAAFVRYQAHHDPNSVAADVASKIQDPLGAKKVHVDRAEQRNKRKLAKATRRNVCAALGVPFTDARTLAELETELKLKGDSVAVAPDAAAPPASASIQPAKPSGQAKPNQAQKRPLRDAAPGGSGPSPTKKLKQKEVPLAGGQKSPQKPLPAGKQQQKPAPNQGAQKPPTFPKKGGVGAKGNNNNNNNNNKRQQQDRRDGNPHPNQNRGGERFDNGPQQRRFNKNNGAPFGGPGGGNRAGPWAATPSAHMNNPGENLEETMRRAAREMNMGNNRNRGPGGYGAQPTSADVFTNQLNLTSVVSEVLNRLGPMGGGNPYGSGNNGMGGGGGNFGPAFGNGSMGGMNGGGYGSGNAKELPLAASLYPSQRGNDRPSSDFGRGSNFSNGGDRRGGGDYDIGRYVEPIEDKRNYGSSAFGNSSSNNNKDGFYGSSSYGGSSFGSSLNKSGGGGAFLSSSAFASNSYDDERYGRKSEVLPVPPPMEASSYSTFAGAYGNDRNQNNYRNGGRR